MTPSDLKKWRSDNNYTQGELAQILGVSVVTVNRWENEARKLPSFLDLALNCILKKKPAAVTKSKRGKGVKS